MYSYYVYILTNKYRTTFYIGVTNNLKRRLTEHHQAIKLKKNTFAGRYNLYDLIYYEKYENIKTAITREKELKGWRKEKKMNLIKKQNENFRSYNEHVLRWG
jgi:putative endonuclease